MSSTTLVIMVFAFVASLYALVFYIDWKLPNGIQINLSDFVSWDERGNDE